MVPKYHTRNRRPEITCKRIQYNQRPCLHVIVHEERLADIKLGDLRMPPDHRYFKISRYLGEKADRTDSECHAEFIALCDKLIEANELPDETYIEVNYYRKHQAQSWMYWQKDGHAYHYNLDNHRIYRYLQTDQRITPPRNTLPYLSVFDSRVKSGRQSIGVNGLGSLYMHCGIHANQAKVLEVYDAYLTAQDIDDEELRQLVIGCIQKDHMNWHKLAMSHLYMWFFGQMGDRWIVDTLVRPTDDPHFTFQPTPEQVVQFQRMHLRFMRSVHGQSNIHKLQHLLLP